MIKITAVNINGNSFLLAIYKKPHRDHLRKLGQSEWVVLVKLGIFYLFLLNQIYSYNTLAKNDVNTYFICRLSLRLSI